MEEKILSLRSRLLLLIILPLIFIVSIGTVALYFNSQKKSQEIFDNLLHTISQVILRDAVLRDGDLLTEQLLETLTDSLNDQIFYQVRNENNTLFVGYSNPPEIPNKLEIKPYQPIFYDSIYLDQSVRVIFSREFISSMRDPDWVNIYVWQTQIGQRQLLLELAADAFITMIIMLISTALIVWFGVQYGLKPLLELQSAIRKRSADDISEIKRAVPKEVSSLLNSMNSLFSQLRKAFIDKDEFIANAAHQLRNPIAGIQSQAEAAERSKTLESMKIRIKDVAMAAKKTSRLTQQLLSMEHVSQRSIKSEFKNLDLVKLTQEILTKFALKADKQNVNLSLDFNEQSIQITGSETYLGEAIDNLIDNALLYGCPNGGEINVELKLESDSALLFVKDNGNGIKAELIDSVFDRFFYDSEANIHGSGLGLSIAKTIIELHDGSLTLTSDNKGTCLTIKLPANY
ncbi:sensor histidine kinase [Candidatus Thioglobus sp.]|nr:sensor histidine kinase [Candidatus Thioglobus sp.]MDA8981722.1 sensor histidine kinase [Candidatus Thioglobus sp.]MDC1319052.1 sensor histidine kinase [Candidatus Thioglobus sp.]